MAHTSFEENDLEKVGKNGSGSSCVAAKSFFVVGSFKGCLLAGPMSLPLSAETGCQRNSEDIQILLMTKLCAATNYLRYVAVKTCDLFDCRFDLMCMVWPLKSERWGRSGLIFECLPAVTLLSRHPGIKFSLIYSQESPVIKRLTTALWRRRRRTRARHFNCQLNRTLPRGKQKHFLQNQHTAMPRNLEMRQR